MPPGSRHDRTETTKSGQPAASPRAASKGVRTGRRAIARSRSRRKKDAVAAGIGHSIERARNRRPCRREAASFHAGSGSPSPSVEAAAAEKALSRRAAPSDGGARRRPKKMPWGRAALIAALVSDAGRRGKALPLTSSSKPPLHHPGGLEKVSPRVTGSRCKASMPVPILRRVAETNLCRPLANWRNLGVRNDGRRACRRDGRFSREQLCEAMI